jgi:FkbM family methyltransferase
MNRDGLLVFLTDLIFFGFPNGLLVFWKRKSTKGEVKVKLKQYPHPFYLRGGSSDFYTFDQIFKSKEVNIKIHVQSGDYIVDGGANVGLASIFLSQLYPLCTIIAIEPEASNFHQLLRNTKQYSNIVCLQKALWPETAFLQIENPDSEKWGFTVKEGHGSGKIESITIPQLLDTYKIKEIALLKVDIEGAELELFSNAEAWLPKVKNIAIELHDNSRVGCSKSFFTAIIKGDFSINVKGEKIIASRNS